MTRNPGTHREKSQPGNASAHSGALDHGGCWYCECFIKNDKKQSTVLLKEQEALLFLLHIR